jgi:hypothetical protein
MSFNNKTEKERKTEAAPAAPKFPRGLAVLIIMAVFAVLIWRFAANTGYFWYSIGAAVLLTFGVIVLIYRPFSKSKRSDERQAVKAPKDHLEVELDKIDVETDYTDSPAILRNGKSQAFGADAAKAEVQPFSTAKPAPGAPKPGLSKKVLADLEGDAVEAAPENTAIDPTAPPVPLVDDETTLTDDEKNQLVNAVWYRCENPYCKYTSFLGVHHIVDEKEGGTNRLDNLIVLCPYCHDLAHRNEIPEKELRDWISNRENRFKSKPNWKYF